jgi:hypothetical protein
VRQGPLTGHSAVGLRQAGKCLLRAEATFHCAIITLGNQVIRACLIPLLPSSRDESAADVSATFGNVRRFGPYSL